MPREHKYLVSHTVRVTVYNIVSDTSASEAISMVRNGDSDDTWSGDAFGLYGFKAARYRGDEDEPDDAAPPHPMP